MPRTAGRPRKATDADRDAALEELRRAHVCGTIGIEDLRIREAVVHLSGTVAELAALTDDLRRPTGAHTRKRMRWLHWERTSPGMR